MATRLFSQSRPALGFDTVFEASKQVIVRRGPSISWLRRRPTAWVLPKHVARSFSIARIDRNASVGAAMMPAQPPVSVAPAPYWSHVPAWRDVEESEFLSYRWQVHNTIERKEKLVRFLEDVLPMRMPRRRTQTDDSTGVVTREEFIADVEDGLRLAPMAVRLTPHMLSLVDWTNPCNDPIRRQFIPTKSTMVEDHPALSMDSLHETKDSPVPGLVHRYPDKVLFLGKVLYPQRVESTSLTNDVRSATSVCPIYCRFCTRSYAIGSNTETVTKASQKPTRRRWDAAFEYIERNPAIQDVVVSGGDSYHLQPEQLRMIGERLLSVTHIQRIRFATKGLVACPMRIFDSRDAWADVFVELSNRGRALGKQVAMHTHFNHPHEITWSTAMAARHLFAQGVIVRNQSVLLRGINDDVATMSTLIRALADLNIEPYYVFQADMVRGVEDLRTPLRTILDLEKNIRGTIAGFMMPNFVVDLPGGGGKRLAASFESYDERSGMSTWKAPGVTGGRSFTYHDPL